MYFQSSNFFTIGGFDYFAEAYPDAKVYAHKTLQGYMQQLLNVRNKITQKRAVFQFGTELSDKEHENSGIGIRLKLVFFCYLSTTNKALNIFQVPTGILVEIFEEYCCFTDQNFQLVKPMDSFWFYSIF